MLPKTPVIYTTLGKGDTSMGESSDVLDLQNVTMGKLRRIIEYINDNQSALDSKI